MRSEIHVGFLGGIELSTNVRTLLKNIRRLLRSRERTFQCDLLISGEIDPPNDYNSITIDHGPVDSARDRIRVLANAVRQYSNQKTPDVLVQLTRFPTHGTALALAGWQSDIPTITRLGGDNFHEYQFAESAKETVRTFVLKNVIALVPVHLSNAVVVLGPNGRQDIERRFRRKNVWEIPQPVNQSQFTPGPATDLRSTLDIPPDHDMLLTVGRVSRRKGAETIRNIAPTLNDTTWVVVGDGPMRETLNGIEGVHTTGNISHDRIVDYYRAADLYVHPSLHEGLPNVMLEATACGTPCISRNVGECETVAAETFIEDDGLAALINRTYEPVKLDERFEDERLAKRYESILVKTSQQ